MSVGYPGGKVGNTPEEIVEYALSFSDNVKYKDAKTLVATTGRYTDFSNFTPGNPFVDGAQLSIITAAETDFKWLISRVSIYAAVKENEAAFDFGTHEPSDLASVEDEVNKLITKTGKLAAQCYSKHLNVTIIKL